MPSLLDTFAGMLDRSVRELTRLAADARGLDLTRAGRIADIWDNNTHPLISAAGAAWPLRGPRARAGLHWMAGQTASRRALLVELDPALDDLLPPPGPDPGAYRTYHDLPRPRVLELTDRVTAELQADYDLATAAVRSLTARPDGTGLEVRLVLAAARTFTPTTGRVALDGSRKPWPPALLRYTFTGVTDLRFDADDRTGLTVACGDTGHAVTIGDSGRLRAAGATVLPDDPCWHESVAGRAARLTIPPGRLGRQKPITIATLTRPQQAAARALVLLMIQVRSMYYHPRLAATVPFREICGSMADAGSAILAASARHGRGRRAAFAELEQRWRAPLSEVEPAPVDGPSMLLHASYSEAHDDHDVWREGSAVVLAAVPGAHPEAGWDLAGGEIKRPAGFRITDAAFEGEQMIRHSAGVLAIKDAFTVRAA